MSIIPKPAKRGPKGRTRLRKNPLGDHRKQVKVADDLFSKYIRARDGFCMVGDGRSGCAGSLQCAHLFSRRYRSTRWNPLNAWAACAGHHVYYTHHPIEWDDLIREALGKDYERLRLLAQSRTKFDMPELIFSLRHALAAQSTTIRAVPSLEYPEV